MGVHFNYDPSDFEGIPGLIYTSIPTFKTPSRILPPTTPPFKSEISEPGLLTSKLLIIIIFGETVKFL